MMICACVLQWVRWKNIEWRIKRHFPKLHHHIFARFCIFWQINSISFWHCFCDVGSFWVQFNPDTVQRNGLYSPNNFCLGKRLSGKTNTHFALSMSHHTNEQKSQRSRRINSAPSQCRVTKPFVLNKEGEVWIQAPTHLCNLPAKWQGLVQI